VVVASGGDLLIVVVTEKTAQLGMVRLEAHRAAEALL
jgi:predicted regulator of Ras-like GTPase activity (Roadblock/LC7/MglB family)